MGMCRRLGPHPEASLDLNWTILGSLPGCFLKAWLRFEATQSTLRAKS